MPPRLASVLLALVLVLAGCGGAEQPHDHSHGEDHRQPDDHDHEAVPAHDHDHGHEHGDDHELTPEEHARLHPSPDRDPDATCICASARIEGGWCHACANGWLAGLRVDDWRVFDAIDAHGHPLPAAVTCAACEDAMATDGFCAEHRMGFFGRRVYFSRLTHALARGAPGDTASIECDTCRANAADRGWCEACGAGMIGNVAFEDRAVWQSAVDPWRSLQGALMLEETCLDCPAAAALDTTCPRCLTAYRLGRPAD